MGLFQMSPGQHEQWARWRTQGRWHYALFATGTMLLLEVPLVWLFNFLLPSPDEITTGLLLRHALLWFGLAQVVWIRNEKLFATFQPVAQQSKLSIRYPVA